MRRMGHGLHRRVRIEPGKRADLAKIDADDTLGLERDEAEELVRERQERLEVLQGYLKWGAAQALVVLFQGMDAGGKDGAVRQLVAGLNPMIVNFVAFGKPTKEELAHDFLWRIRREVPERGEISLFNRSHYEDVLVVRVDELVPEPVWRPRFEVINTFEAELARQGTTVVKFMLHVSRDEQLERLAERATLPEKHWKHSADDMRKRGQWDAYMEAYEEAIKRTGTEVSPWYVVPADRKWVRNAVVLDTVVHTLEEMRLPTPTPPEDAAEELLNRPAGD